MKIIDPALYKELNDFYSKYSHLRQQEGGGIRNGSEPPQKEEEEKVMKTEEDKVVDVESEPKPTETTAKIHDSNIKHSSDNRVDSESTNHCLEGWARLGFPIRNRKGGKLTQSRTARRRGITTTKKKGLKSKVSSPYFCIYPSSIRCYGSTILCLL